MSNALEVERLTLFGIAARRTGLLVLTAVCLIVTLGGPTTAAAQPATPSGRRIVTIDALREFLQSLARRNSSEYPTVFRDAEQQFPKGTVLESFPESMSEQLPRQAPDPLRLVRRQVERDGLDPNGLKAVTIFKGDNGTILVDIIVVLVRESNAVAGVYGAFWGR